MPPSKRCKVQLSSLAQYTQITERHELSTTPSRCQKHKPSDGRLMSQWEGRMGEGEGDGALGNWTESETGPNKNCWHLMGKDIQIAAV